MNGPVALEEIRARVAGLGLSGWIVGGAIRDALRGRTVLDMDIAVPGDARSAARDIARAHGAATFPLSDAFGAWRVTGGTLPFQIDLTPLQGADIGEDLARRDLTVNAMALAVEGGDLEDPFGGRGDLAAGILRMVRPDAFTSDPVRLVRLARIACQTGFIIDPDTHLRARMDAATVTRSAGERVLGEMRLIAQEDEAWRGIDVLDEIGVLGVLVPDLEEGRGLEQTPYHHLDVLGHTLEVVRYACEIRRDPEDLFRGDAAFVADALRQPLADGLTRWDGLLFAALFHDVGKARTFGVTAEGRITFMGHDRVGAEIVGEWCPRFGASTRFREVVVQCVREHLRLGFLVHRQPLGLRTIIRYWWATSPADIELLILSAADRLATDGPRTTPPQISRHLDVVRQVTRVIRELTERGEPDPLLDGNEIIALADRTPGPWVRDIVTALREDQLVGLVTTRAQAERLVREHIDGDA